MKRLKAGALQLVTFVVVIIAVLLMMLLLLVHTQNLYKLKTQRQHEALVVADNELRAAINEPQFLDNRIDHTTQPFTSSSQTDFWGSFYTSKTVVEWGTQKVEKIGLAGMTRQEQTNVALYLKDNNRPLALVGQTYLEGQVYLPKRGIKSGSIAGYAYTRPQFVYGTLEPIKEFPEIKPELKEYIQTLVVTAEGLNGTAKNHNLRNGEDLVNSFLKPLMLISKEEPIVLANQRLIGHVMIRSESEIIVESSAVMGDVILVAPKVTVQQGFKGAVQIFASDQILLEEEVHLAYPSALVVSKNEPVADERAHGIVINDKSTLQGNLVYINSGTVNYKPQVRISSNAKVSGLVYCEQNLELRGTVEGTVVTNNFIIEEKGSVYQNHLFNAKIVAGDLDPHFVGLDLGLHRKEVAKCLY